MAASKDSFALTIRVISLVANRDSPINIAANGSDDKGFVQTTATNVPEKSYLLFAHATLIVLFVVVRMWHCVSSLVYMLLTANVRLLCCLL